MNAISDKSCESQVKVRVFSSFTPNAQWLGSRDGDQNSKDSKTEQSRAQVLLLAKCYGYCDEGDIGFTSPPTSGDPAAEAYTSKVSLLSAKLLRKS